MHPLFHPLFVDYCVYFNGNKDYFECHEVLEEYWKEIAPKEKEHALVGYIQVATGLYHWRRGNLVGASRILHKARKILLQNTQSIFVEYIALDELLQQVENSLLKITANKTFSSFQFPITNVELQSVVSKKIKLLPIENPSFLLNKHMLRDRSSILLEREEKKKKKTAYKPRNI